MKCAMTKDVPLHLHGFWRSTASWRVRIALALKDIPFTQSAHHLRKGEQKAPDFLVINPQGLVPVLEIDGHAPLSQSLAICEYLDEAVPEPSLLPGSSIDRARVRALAMIIACDIHPIQNLKILSRLRALGHDEDVVNQWARTVIEDGLDAFEKLAGGYGGRFAYGHSPTLADICLVPQLGNARRFGVKIRWPHIRAIEEACNQLDAFQRSVPGQQPDAE